MCYNKMAKKGREVMKPKYTPMMMQYLEIKEQYSDTIVMFRLGDFYEMFFDDAKMVSKELELTLTGRDAGAEERVPMCGVPHHAASTYIQRLVDNGHKVAIVEQLQDPSVAEGIVKRGVVQIITPGTVMDNGINDNNFICAMMAFDFQYALAFCDLATGEMMVETIDKKQQLLENEVLGMHIKEMVVPSQVPLDEYKTLQQQYHVMISKYDDDTHHTKHESLFKAVKDFKQMKVASLLLNYLEQTQKREIDYIQPIIEIENNGYLKMDVYAKNALELTQTIRAKEKYGSLLWLLDKTKTAMGSRMLKQWVDKPLTDEEKINERLDIVELFNDNFIERESIKEILKEVYDLERLAARVAFGNINARDVIWIGKTLKVVPELKYQLQTLNHPLTTALADRLVDLSHITDLIESAFVETPPLSIKEGGMFKKGFNEQLDEYLDASINGKQWLLDFEKKEREKTGINKLRVGYNKVFGYYIEVTRSYLPQITDDLNYTRKQSLANAERFITPELKEMEQKILTAEDKITKVEYELFVQIRDFIKKDVHLLQDVSKVIAMVDVYIALAHISSQNRYVRPIFNHDNYLEIKDGRHAVIEEVMKQEKYVENDIYMPKDTHLLMITGPNMGGKSTYMRQVALIVIMAQIGCFVPASIAKMPIFDQLFTRIGASDDLISGQSTFMVEMLEANHAIRQATKNSLVIFDEIGRGTATFDGMAIAQAMAEYLASQVQCKVLFSTHYHELTFLDERIPGIQNVHVSVMEKSKEIVFLYKIKNGRANKSYGVNVARLALLPDEILNRADTILKALEENNIEKTLKEAPIESNTSIVKEASPIELYLSKMDPLNMSPMDALSAIMELKKFIEK